MKKYLLTLLLIFIFIAAGCSDSQTTEAENTNEAPAQSQNEQNESGNDSAEAKIDYPTRTIEIIAGGGPGGGTDTYARAVARELSEILGVTVNVVNHPGAAGAVATHELVGLPADGYAIMTTVSDFQINISAERTPNFLEDNVISPLARLHDDTYTILVKSDGKFADIDEFINTAKENPGKITIGGTASLGIDELTVRAFENEAGIQLNYVPYENAGQMHAALVGGHVDALLEEPGPAISLIEDGSVDIIVVFAQDRLKDYPEVPTTVEKGWNLYSGMSRGFVIHADVPDEIKEILENALKEVLATERYQEFAESQFLHLKDGWLDSDEYQSFLENEIVLYQDILKELGN